MDSIRFWTQVTLFVAMGASVPTVLFGQEPAPSEPDWATRVLSEAGGSDPSTAELEPAVTEVAPAVTEAIESGLVAKESTEADPPAKEAGLVTKEVGRVVDADRQSAESESIEADPVQTSLLWLFGGTLLIVVFGWILSRFASRRKLALLGGLEVLETLRVGSGHVVASLRVQDRVHVVVLAPQAIEVIDTFPMEEAEGSVSVEFPQRSAVVSSSEQHGDFRGALGAEINKAIADVEEAPEPSANVYRRTKRRRRQTTTEDNELQEIKKMISKMRKGT